MGTYKDVTYGHPSEWGNDEAQPPDLNGDVKASNNDTLTAHFVWTGPGDVPDHADFLIHSSVSASASVSYGQSGLASGLSGDASASLGGMTVTATAKAPEDNGNIFSGSPSPLERNRLIRVKPDGNIATVSQAGGVSTNTSNGLPYGWWQPGDTSSGGCSYYSYGNGLTSASASANATASAAPDLRDVMISSDAEPNSKRGKDASGNWAPIPNNRNSDGSMSIDTVAPLPYSGSPLDVADIKDLTYSPVYDKTAWGNNSSWEWSASQGVPKTPASGTFNALWPNLDVGSYEIGYINPPVAGGATDTITLTLTDGADGAVAENTYGVTFHDPYEDFTIDPAQNVDSPAIPPTDHTSSLPPPWRPYTGYIVGPTMSTEDCKDTHEVGSEWSIEGSSGDAAFEKLLGIKVGYTHTDTNSEEVGHSQEYDVPDGQVWQFYWTPHTQERGGTCSVWAKNGYQNETTWHTTENRLVDWSYVIISAGSGPH